jgi:hypothetical protein
MKTFLGNTIEVAAIVGEGVRLIIGNAENRSSSDIPTEDARELASTILEACDRVNNGHVFPTEL